MCSTSEAVTRGIRVRVRARYAPEHSEPAAHNWLFLYSIAIRNEGPCQVQLLRRHWLITDAHGEVEEVRGSGVVGKQPVLGQGEQFEYTSACPLKTPFGSMHGSYEFRDADDELFQVEVAGFALRQPGTMQ